MAEGGFSVDIQIVNLDAIISRFNSSQTIHKQEIGDALEKSVVLLHRSLASYTQDSPPKPAGSTYVRTFTLARQITHKVERGNFLARVGTNLGYGKYVIGAPGDQAAIHAGRWYTIMSKAEEHGAAILAFFKTAENNLLAYLAG